MTEPVDPKPEQQPGPVQPEPQQPGPVPQASEHSGTGEHPTEQLHRGAADAWTPPPVGAAAPAEPHTVFLGNTYEPPAPPVAPSTPGRSAKGALSAAGLLLGGLIVGAVAVWAVQSQSSDAAQTSATSGLGAAPNQNGAPNGSNGSGQNQLPTDPNQNGSGQGNAPGRGFGGGLAGEQRLAGTITAVGDHTVTVRANGATKTYGVVSDTEIIRNGSQASLSDLKAGDLAFLHVYPQGSTMLVERIFAGALPGGGQGIPGFGGGPQDQQNGSGSGSTTTT